MALADSVFARTRTANARVFIGGVNQGLFLDATENRFRGNVLSISLAYGLDRPVPTATIRFRVLPSVVNFGDRVTVFQGFDGYEVVTFQGIVTVIDRTHSDITVECEGVSRALEISFTQDGYTFSSTLAATAVGQLLNSAGLVDRDIDMEAWTIGAVQGAIVDVNTLGEAVRKIIEVDGHRLWQSPGGGIIVRRLELFPSGTSFATYRSSGATPMILAASQRKSFDRIRNRITVRGATLIDVDADGNQTTEQIEATATGTSPYTPRDSAGAEVIIEELYQNELIETNAKASIVALRLLGEALCPVIETEIELPADPRIALGMTVGIEDTYSGVTGRWIVGGYTTVMEARRYTMRLQVFGGPLSCGTGNLSPIADFTWRSERELMSTSAPRVIVTYVSTAHDLDGSISTLAWLDDQGNSGGGEQETFSYLASLGTIQMTLTATDNSGAVSAITKTIDLVGKSQSGQRIVIPAFLVAAEGYVMYSPDGGVSWRDRTASDVGVGGQSIISCDLAQPNPDDFGLEGAIEAVLLVGTDGGSLARSADSGQTWSVVATGLGSAVNDVKFNPQLPTEAWAVTQGGRIYRSNDFGVTWVLYQELGWNLRTVGVRADAVVWVGGGDTGAPETLLAYDLRDGLLFRPITPGGSLLTLPVGGYAAAFDFTPFGWEMAMVLSGVEPAIHFVGSDPIVNSNWQAATGLDAGLTGGRNIAWAGWLPGRLMAVFNNRDTWISDNGVAWTKQATVFGVGVAPWYALLVNQQTDVFLVGASDGVYKTYDRGATVGYVRPIAGYTTWPAGNEARQVATGVGAIPPGGFLLAGANSHVAVKRPQQRWTEVDLPDTLPNTGIMGFARQFYSGLTEVLMIADKDSNSGSWLRRSTDGGATWTVALDSGGGLNSECRGLWEGADGALWALMYVTLGQGQWYKSTDKGATWSSAGLHGHALATPAIEHSNVSPSDANRLVEIDSSGAAPSQIRVGLSTDGGVTFNHVNLVMRPGGLPGGVARVIINRLNTVFALEPTEESSLKARIYRSRDNIATWTMVKEFDDDWIGSPSMQLLGNQIYAGGREGTNWKLFRADEEGEAWTEIYGPGGYTAPFAASAYDQAGLAYDPFTGDLYLHVRDRVGPPPLDGHIMKLEQGAAIWTNNDVGLAADLGHAEEGGFDALALLLELQ